MQKFICFLVFTFFILSTNTAQDAAIDFKTKSISLFKNGSAFYLKSGKVRSQKGTYRITKNIPSALFGTFWIQSPTDELNFVSSYNDKVEESTKTMTVNFAQSLSANLGKKVRLHIGKDEIIEGVVEEVEEIKNSKDDTAFSPSQFLITNLLTFRMDSLWMTISVAEIRRIEFLEKPNQILESKVTQNKPVLSFNFVNQKAEQNLEMMYLQNGLSWTPGYLIELIDDEKAQLTLRAQVINNAEDIEKTDINFVVGVPNFRFANRLSSLVDFYNSYVPAVNAGFSNSMQVSSENAYEILEDQSSFLGLDALASQVTGSAEEDLFFYNLKNFSLKKGGRGHYPIFSKQIEIAHIYECNLNANNANQNYFQESFLFSPDNTDKVFHSVKVNNDTEFPWTTGVAMVVKGTKDQKPISQDQLNYTPIKGHSFIKLTEAPDVKVKHAEKEIAREDKVMKNPQNKNYYLDLVTVEGQVKIKNYKAKKIDLNIRRTITGELISTSSKWLESMLVTRNGQNKINNVCWETSIDTGEELIINYKYKVYVPD
jgi:hypothetical protein